MLEAVTNARALPGGVLQQDAELCEIEIGCGRLQARRAGAYAVRLARTFRAARMHDEIVRAERDAALYLFAERGDGLRADRLIRCREIDQVVRVDDDGRDLC